MKIDCIYVNTYRYDYMYLRICIASIRYWYPDIPVLLIKDLASGNFNTHSLEKKWGLRVLNTPFRLYGWGFGKLEPLFFRDEHHFLVVDSDTVFTGFVLDGVKDIDADFIVDEETQPDEEVGRLYYKTDLVKKILPGFQYPGYTFNSGQWFGTSNRVSREDLKELVEWKPMPQLKHPDCFMPGDQGILNAIVHYKEAAGKISVHRKKIMCWPKDNGAAMIELDAIRARQARFNFIIHWAGLKRERLPDHERYDIMKFYLEHYQEGMSALGKLRMNLADHCLRLEQKIRYRFKKATRSFIP